MRVCMLPAIGMVLLFWSSCGGSRPMAPARPSVAESPGGTVEGGEQQSVAGCADETCFVCGEGRCLRGFFCDETLSGGAACSWLPECGKDTTCSCVQAALGSGCDCEERDGGVFVRCR